LKQIKQIDIPVKFTSELILWIKKIKTNEIDLKIEDMPVKEKK
jgi:hypothetical protein